MTFQPPNDTVNYEIRDRVAWIGLNRPAQLNALNYYIRQALGECVIEADRDDGVLVVVLYGEGGRAFSAGNDLKQVAATDLGEQVPKGHSGGQEVGACSKPTIAAIDGYALAGGMEITARCDMRIATEKSRFGMPEARRSLVAVGFPDTPERYFPLGEAMWILLSGTMGITAQRCHELGFVQFVEPDRDALFERAEWMANEIKQCAPLAVRTIKTVARDGRWFPPEVTRHFGGQLKERTERSEDRLEGPRAFAEKRAPNWKGR